MKHEKALEELGLSGEESIVYVALLRLGGSIASVVAKDVGIKRTTVYAILKSLAEKGFVTMYYRKNKQLYYAEKPERVADYFSKKITNFTEIIPALESLGKKQIQISGIRLIETVDELKKFYRGVLGEYKNKTYHIIGNANAWEGIAPEFFKDFRVKRGKEKVATKLLLTSDSKGINPAEKEMLREFKYLPAKYSFKSTIDIFDDKILIVSPELSCLAIVIAVPAMVDVFRMVFQMLWDFLDEKTHQ